MPPTYRTGGPFNLQREQQRRVRQTRARHSRCGTIVDFVCDKHGNRRNPMFCDGRPEWLDEFGVPCCNGCYLDRHPFDQNLCTYIEN